MIQTLLLACALLQDPKPGPRTVEDRLKELDEKLTVLEKKQRELSEDNAAMEKKIADGKAARENALRMSAKFWVQHFAKPLDLTEKQAVDLENLRYGWYVEDREKPADESRWKSREASLREKLSAGQSSQLARTVRGDLEGSAKAWIRMFIQSAKLAPEKTAALEKAAFDAMPTAEGVLLPEAHPEGMGSWSSVAAAIESALPKVLPALTEAEQAALRNAIAPWKARRP
jgi:hypothetical protein